MTATVSVPPVHAPSANARIVATVRRMQGRSKREIPQSIIDAVCLAFVRDGTPASSITREAVDDVLRRLGRSGGRPLMGSHRDARQIADTLRGTPPLRLTDAQEDGLRDAFDRAVHSLQAIGLAECIDLLRTEWVALRLLRLFGYPAHVVDQLATLFPRSRDDDPFYRDTWARICADNGWHCDLAVSDSSGSETAGS